MGEASAALEVIDTMDVPTLMVLCILGFWKLIKALHAIEVRMASSDQTTKNRVNILDSHVKNDETVQRELTDSINRLTDRVNENTIHVQAARVGRG